MCIGICAIATQRGSQRLYFKSGINSHSDIREACQLKDDKPAEQVNLEAHLIKGSFYNPKNWKVVVDHEVGDIPQWFKDDQAEIEGLFLEFLEAELKEAKATKTYKGSLQFNWRTVPKGGLVLPTTMGGPLDLGGLTSAEGLVLPKEVGGWLDLSGLTSAEGLVLPTTVGGNLDLRGLSRKEREDIRKKGYRVV